MKLKGADPKSKAEGQEPLPGKSNYFIGSNRSQWKTNVSQFAKVQFRDVYPGIDLVYYGSVGNLEYDFIIKPKADLSRIRLKFEGEKSLQVDKSGDLEVAVGDEKIKFKLPAIYQPRPGGRESIQGRFVLNGNEAGFKVGPYDSTRSLVIDPTLTLAYSTYVSPENAAVVGGAHVRLAVDPAGNAYLVGSYPAGFPTSAGAAQGAAKGTINLVVTKLDPTGSNLLYATYLGGTAEDDGYGIAVDSAGNAYVTGLTLSSDYPVTPGALQLSLKMAAGVTLLSNGFVSKINPTGTGLVYSTYLGGSGRAGDVSDGYADFGFGIALDGAGDAYVTGTAYSPDFPVTPGAFQPAIKGIDAFVAKLDPTGTKLIFSTFLGASGIDQGLAIAVDGSGNAYATGYTNGPDFPVTPGAFQTTFLKDTFTEWTTFNYVYVSKFDPTGALVYSTYLGGTDGGEGGAAIAVDGAGDAYVMGTTYSTDFPVTPGALHSNLIITDPSSISWPGSDDFVTKLNPTGTGLIYSTYLGGTHTITGGPGLWGGAFMGTDGGIAVDTAGNAYVCLTTAGPDFPTTAGAFYPSGVGIGAWWGILNPTGTALSYATYWGNSSASAEKIALDPTGAIYLAGNAGSTNFPITSGAYQTTSAGDSMYVSKLILTTPTATATFSPTFTATSTPSITPTNTPSLTPTPTLTFSPTITSTATPTFTPACVIHVWPDPFNPKYAVGGALKIGCLPLGAVVDFYTVSGEFVREASESSGVAIWDGRNRYGSSVAGGAYYYVVKNGDQVSGSGKFLVIR